MSAKTTKVTLLATTVLLSALYQSHAFANELPAEPNAIIEVSDVKAETADKVTSSEVVTNSSSNGGSNGEEPSETTATAPVATNDVTNSETVTNSNASDANSNVVNEQINSASSSNDAPAASDNSTSVLPQVQAGSNTSAITNTVATSSSNSASSSNTQNSSSDSSGGNSVAVSNDASSEEVVSNLSTEVDDVLTAAKESEAAIPRSVIAKAPVQATSSLGLSSISNVVSSKSTIGQKLFFGLILALMFGFGFLTYNKKKKNDLSYL